MNTGTVDMTLAEQLTEVYLKYETWHKEKISKEEADKYHARLLSTGNIITVEKEGQLLGYVEFWRLSYEQFGRIIAGEPFSAYCEDVQSGHIAYVANTYILPEYRRGGVYRMLRDRFFEANKHCTHFVGEARRKKSAPVKVFKRSEVI